MATAVAETVALRPLPQVIGRSLVAAEPRLNVCLLAACPFPANHGTPGSIRELAEATSQRGHEVHVVTYHIKQDIPIRGPFVHRVKPLLSETGVVVGPTIRRPLYDLQMVFTALRVIRQQKIDIMHAHGYEAALVAWICKLLTGVPVLYSGHNTMSDELPSYDFFRWKWIARTLARGLDAFIPRIGDRCVPHSKNIEKFFHGMGLGGRTDPIINFGIDIEAIAQGDGRRVGDYYGLGDAPVILYTGVMDRFQRLDLLLEAMPPVLFYEPRAKLLLVVTIHNSRHIDNIQRQARKLGISKNVVLTDPQPFERVGEFLQACDVAVVPRPGAPGFPIKLLNYMAAGKAAVLFASSASNLTHGENVYLVPQDTGQALGEGILEVLRDEQLRQRLADGGYHFVRAHHDRRLTAEQICNSYCRTLQQTGRWQRMAGREAVQVADRTDRRLTVLIPRSETESHSQPQKTSREPAGVAT